MMVLGIVCRPWWFGTDYPLGQRLDKVGDSASLPAPGIRFVVCPEFPSYAADVAEMWQPFIE